MPDGVRTSHYDEPVGAGTAACASDRAAKAVEVDRSGDCLAAVGDRAFVSAAVEERRFAVFTKQAVAIGVHRCRGASLLFRQDLTSPIAELGRRAAVSAGDAPPCCIVNKTALCAASGCSAEELTIVVIREGVGRARECTTCLFAIGVVGVTVDEATRAAGSRRQLGIAVESECCCCSADRLAGAVSDGVHGVGGREGIGPPRLRCGGSARVADGGTGSVLDPRWPPLCQVDASPGRT